MADNESTIRDEDGDFSDWIEIRNTSDALNVGGWFLTDDADDLTKWRLPNLDLNRDEHVLVFASNKDRRVAGNELHTNFKLSNSGEYLALVMPDGTIATDFAPTYPKQYDDVSYGLSANLSQTGYFVEPTPGTANNATPVADPTQAIVITEIMYHPASEDLGAEYIEIHNQGAQTINLRGWQFTDGIDFTFPQVSIGAGGYLVVAADVATFDANHPGVANRIGGWTGQLSNGGEQIELVNSVGLRVDAVTYADQGDWATRAQVIDGGEEGWAWQAFHDGGDDEGNQSKSLELINRSMPNDNGQNWTSSLPNGGTPGSVNSVDAADSAPIIEEVRNLPIIPRSSDSVTVTAKITDEMANPTVRVHYRIDGAPTFTTRTLNDVGQDNDETSGDNVYTATLPSQADGVVVEFYLSATDLAGNQRTWPAADTSGAQSANALYQVNDEYDPNALWQAGDTPRFYQVMRSVDREDFLSPGFNEDSNAQKNASFVVWDGTGVDVRHTAGVRIRGSASRGNAIKSNRINLASDNPWHGITQLNINAPNPADQISGSALWRLAGLFAADSSPVRMFSNGEDLKEGGAYNYLETPNSDMAANQFAGDSDGNLYRGRRNNESPEGGRSAGLTYEGPIGVPAPDPPDNPYASYMKLTNSGLADWTDVAELTFQLNNCGTSDTFDQCAEGEYNDDYIDNVENVVDIDQWLRSLALSAMLDNNEGGLLIGDARGDDYIMYRGVEDTRFQLVMHDFDSLYSNPRRSFFRFDGVPALQRLVHHPEILPRYFAQLEDLANVVTSDDADTVLDESLRGVTSQANIDSIKSFLDTRSQYILSEIPQSLTISTGLPEVGEFVKTSSAALTLSGTTPASTTRSVLVNGMLATSLPGDGTWQFASSSGGDAPSGVVLNPGINRVVVEAFDGPNGNGRLIASDYVDVWYDGPAVTRPSEPTAVEVDRLRLRARESYLPDVPTLIRVEALDFGGDVEKDLWDAEVRLTVDNPRVLLSTDRVDLVNGLGSTLVSFRLNPNRGGSEDFTLTAWYRGKSISKQIVSLSDEPVTTVGGDQVETIAAWRGVVRVTEEYVVADGQMLNVLPGTIVLIDGTTDDVDDSPGITVEGSIHSLGTAERPVTFTSSVAGEIWGQIELDAADGTFDHTIITRAGNAPGLGHTGTAAAILMGGDSNLTFRDGSITDLRGKSLYSTSGNVVISNSLLSRSVMGPEITNTALQFDDTWIVTMAGIHHPDGTVDDNDGIYLHDQNDGQVIALRGGVLAGTQDDGIDTLGSTITVDDYIVRDVFDKAVSQFNGGVSIRNSLIVDADIGVNTKGTGTNTPHTVIESTTIANVNTGIYAEDKDTPDPDVVITFDVNNSILRVNDGGDAVKTDYDADNIHIDYSNVAEPWVGTGNSTVDPFFVNAAAGNFHPSPGAATIDAGTPGILEPDGTRIDQGYYKQGFTGQFRTAKTISGQISTDTVLAPQNGPFLVTADTTVTSGTRLVVLPGTSVYFDQDTELIIEGEMIAEGSPYQRIRFTADPNDPNVPNQPDGANDGLPDGPPRWDGLHFSNSRSDVNRIAYADVAYAEDRSGSIGVLDSNALIDSITVAGTHLRMVYGTNVSLVVQNSVFPDMFAEGESPDALGLDNVSEHIKITGQIPDGGQMVIRNNVFGTNKGHNDVIDADSGRSPDPILQVLDNVFMGAGDEELDLGGDVYVAGNLFMNVFKDDETSDRGYANSISTGDAGTGTVITVARNFFVDVDHAINLKRDTATIFENNTVYKIHGDFDDRFGNPNVGGAINLYVDEPGASPGDGAYVEANVVWDAPRLFSNPDLPDGTLSRLEVHNNLLDADVADNTIGNRTDTVLDLGSGNLVGNARFVELASGRLGLGTGSAGLGSGPLGRDMGANIRDGVWIAGEPSGVTMSDSAVLHVGGPGIFAYRYRVDGGDWSSDIPIGNGFDPDNGTVRVDRIALTNLAPGPHVVEVMGQDAAGVWQSTPTVSEPWVVGAAVSGVRINEVLANNGGAFRLGETTPDYIELYNDGTTTFDLSGIGLSDDVDDPNKFVFPSGTTIPAGGYFVVYADSRSGVGLHTGFALSSSGEGVYLAGGALDSVEFGVQLPNQSIGRVGQQSEWALNRPTPGIANAEVLTGHPSQLAINEWFANGNVRLSEDFIELHNADQLPVDLGGLYISDHPNPLPNQHAFTPLSFVDANGFIKLVADGDTTAGADHLNFKLSADRGHLGLFDGQLNQIDSLLYFAQTTDHSQGRVPDGAASFAYSELPTPRLANEQSTTQTERIASIAWSDSWRYDDSGSAPPANWNRPEFNDAAWPSGAGLLGVENEPLPQPLVTELTHGSTAYYFRNDFDLTGDLSEVDVSFSTAIDDGAVVYVNGVEVRRIGMPDGAVSFDTLADRNVNEASIEGTFSVPRDLLVQGTNVIAVEVHQVSLNSGDIVFGIELEATRPVTTPGGNNHRMLDLLNGLRISEIMYDGSNEYLELTNVGVAPLLLEGVRLEGAVDFTFPNRTLAEGESVVVADDLPSFLAAYGSGTNAVGQYSGNLNNGGEEIRLRLPAPYEAAILRFDYESDWYAETNGLGAALELTSPAPVYPLFGQKASWTASAIGGSPGFTGTEVPDGDGVVINEVLSHTDLPQRDAIELFNTSNQAVDVGGWYLSDSATDPTKFRIPIGTQIPAGGSLVFDESDFNPTFGASETDFALDGAHGDDVYLWRADTAGSLVRIADYVDFGAAANGESFARIPNGTGTLAPATRLTLGCQNSPARVGPVILSEIQNDPGSPSAAAVAVDASITSDDLQFVEVYNSTAALVRLTDWRLRGDIDLDFATSDLLDANEAAIVVSFDPSNVSLLNAFRTHYGISSSTKIFGRFSGNLPADQIYVVLQRPDESPLDDPTFVPHLTEDEARVSPSPAVELNGNSLQRGSLASYGGYVTAWDVASATPGSPRFTFHATWDMTGDGLADVQDVYAFQSVLQSRSQNAQFDLTNDGRVDLSDLQRFLNDGLGRRLGDANLDGNVDATDYGAWQSHHFQSVGCRPWFEGDFNGDGFVDGSDFNIWNANKFKGVGVQETGEGVPNVGSHKVRPPRPALASDVANRIAADLSPIDRSEEGFLHVTTFGPPNASWSVVAIGGDDDVSDPTDRRRRPAASNAARRSSHASQARLVSIDDLFTDLNSWL